MAESKDLPYERIEALNKIFEQEKSNKKEKLIVITTIEALMQKMITKEEIYKQVLEFKQGKVFELDNLKQDLINLGYERVDIVDGKGQFCIRGGIVDIGTTKTSGIRIEFWGDEVDSIRSFSITSQRSNKMLDDARIYPSHELIVVKDLKNICRDIENRHEDSETIKIDIQCTSTDEVQIESHQLEKKTRIMPIEFKGFEIIGKLEIPKLNIDKYILKESSSKALKVSVTKLYGPEINEIGNFCIAGHNYNTMLKEIKNF